MKVVTAKPAHSNELRPKIVKDLIAAPHDSILILDGEKSDFESTGGSGHEEEEERAQILKTHTLNTWISYIWSSTTALKRNNLYTHTTAFLK